MTIPDYTILHLSEPFTKTWRIRNAGTCTWTTGYKLVFISGDELGSPSGVSLPINVAPGQTVDLSAPMTAPAAVGHYEGVWQLQTTDGKTFGVGAAGTDYIWVRIRVITPSFSTPTPTLAPPTETIPAASSATEAASATPAATPAPELHYDFAVNACAAQWQSNTGVLPCPGKDGDPNGFVLSLDHAQLEDGTVASLPTMLTFPSDGADGYILGAYPEYEVQAGDHLQASVGCEKDATTCSVLFRVSYLDQAGAPHDLWTLGEFYDGKYFNLDLDLMPEAGQKVKFVLYVSSLGSAAGDRALWVGPRIVHFPAEEPTVTNTPIPTSPPDTSTASPSPTVPATPTSIPVSIATAAPVSPAQTPSIQQIFDSILSFFQRLFGGK